jgi:hypothetical protein
MLAPKPYALFARWTFHAPPSLLDLVCLNLTAAIDLRLLCETLCQNHVQEAASGKEALRAP